jgi:DNA-binding transcriptional MocR family regulator
MSIKVMTMVFDRYPEGGNERLLALAMADHARDDGTRIWPSVAELARKTKQSRSTVQRQIRRMLERGWLQTVRSATGRPGDTNEYRIHPVWIAGGELPATGVKLTPVGVHEDEPDSVDNVVHTGVTTDETGVTTDETGVIVVTPESSRTIREPLTPQPPVSTGGSGKPEDRKQKSGKPPWRWRDTFDGVKARGEQLGVPYDRKALGNSWLDDELLEHDRRYRSKVDAAHIAAGGEPP